MRTVSWYGVVAMLGVAGAVAAPVWADAAAEAQRVAEIAGTFSAGDYAKAVDGAKRFLGGARDPESVTEARRILAESLRKQGLWRPAGGAYTALSRCCPKGSDDALKYGATADVLNATVNGVYKPAMASGEKRKLSDDEALEAALAKWAAFRCTRFKAQCSRLVGARSPQAVIAIVQPAAQEAHGIFVVAPETPADEPRRLAKAAGAKLALIHRGVAATLHGKLKKYEKKMDEPWSFTNVEKKDIKQTSELCKQMAWAEKAFQENLGDLGGPGEWADGVAVTKESTERQAVYNQMAEQFVVPEYDIDYIF